MLNDDKDSTTYCARVEQHARDADLRCLQVGLHDARVAAHHAGIRRAKLALQALTSSFSPWRLAPRGGRRKPPDYLQIALAGMRGCKKKSWRLQNHIKPCIS